MRNDDLKEYVRHLSQDELDYLGSRFKYKLAGDMADIFHYLSRERDLDRWLASAKDSNALFNMLDDLEAVIQKEDSRRAALQEDTVVAA